MILSPIYFIAYKMSLVLRIIARHSIRKHDLVWIYHKYVSYLLFSVKIFGCNLSLTKFETKHLYYTFLNPYEKNFWVYISNSHNSYLIPPSCMNTHVFPGKHFLHPFFLPSAMHQSCILVGFQTIGK